MERVKAGAGLLLLMAQLGAIVYARFAPTRYLCWAPYDQHTNYRLRAFVNGRELSAEEVEKRYKRAPAGFDPRSPAHLWDIVRAAEMNQPGDSRARVTMEYSVNGKARPDWQYPESSAR